MASPSLLSVVPGLGALREYERSAFLPDLVAGITVWAMLVPQALGYSTLAGMPSVYGLYAGIGALLVYWLWGSSRELNVGPESTVAIMIATILAPFAATGSQEYLELAALLAVFVGIVLIIGGVFRLGRIADFLSRPILAGYVFGSGVLIVTSQLPDLLGLDLDAALYATDIGGILRNLGETDLTTLAVGAGSIGLVYAFKRFAPGIPGALVAVVVGVLGVWLLDLDVAVVGAFERGIPIPGLPDVGASDAARLIGPAIAVSLLVYPDSVLTGRSLSTLGRYRLDPNREFFGIGAANVGSGLLGGFAVNGSQSRSFVAAEAGARTQVSNLWAAGFVVLTLLVLAPVFAYLPSAVLAGIVIVAGVGLLDVAEFQRLWTYRRVEFWLGVFTGAAVLVIGMLAGILVAVGLSLLLVVLRASSPHTAILGRLPGTDTYRDVADHERAETYPGLLIYRFDAPLFFANAGRLRDEIVEAVDAADPPISVVILDAESMYDIDSTGAQVFLELLDELDERSVELVLSRVRTELRDEMASAGIDRRLGGDGVFLEVDDAVTWYLQAYPPDVMD